MERNKKEKRIFWLPFTLQNIFRSWLMFNTDKAGRFEGSFSRGGEGVFGSIWTQFNVLRNNNQC